MKTLPWILIALLAGCSSSGKVALTFDDDFIDQWHAHLGLLEEHDAKATFFVTRWDSMTDEEFAWIDDLAAAGHEIAHHGLTHAKPSEYVANNGMQAYIDDEILAATAIMETRGFSPTAYAYPWGGRSDDLDAALSEHFGVLRDSGRIDQIGRSVYEDGDGVLTHGARIDSGYHTMEDVTAVLQEAKRLDGSVVLYAHRIMEESEASHIKPAELAAILAEVNRLGVEWVTVSQIRQ